MNQGSPPQHSGLAWKRSEDEELVQLYIAYVSFGEMVAQLGSTTKSPTMRIKMLSCPFLEARLEIPYERKAYSIE